MNAIEPINKEYLPNLIIPDEYSKQKLFELNDAYIPYSEMFQEEREFLNYLILKEKPQKLLELGVSAGGSSIIILNAIKDFQNSVLYSIDKSEMHYRTEGKKTGYLVDDYQYLKNKWKLFTGDLAIGFLDEIGKEIDFCLIDTVHFNPGEILDFLMVLPYLKENALVVFHDTALHTRFPAPSPETKQEITTSLLMSTVYGEKFLPSDISKTQESNINFANIGAIKINKDTKEHIWEIFNLLMLSWFYCIDDVESENLINYFRKAYGNYYGDYFKRIVDFQNNVLKADFINSNANNMSLMQKIFSITNKTEFNNKKVKTLTILGKEFKIKEI